MALTDFEVFSKFAYTSKTETFAQEIEKFNEASQGTIILRQAANVGDFNDTVLYKQISGLVRRRNAYGSGAVNPKNLEHLLDTSVKVAAGTPPVNIDPGMFKWIQRNPEEAGVVIGVQLAEQSMADMLNAAILAAYAAMVQTTAILYNATSDTPDTLTLQALNKAARKFGDRSQDIAAWITHSVPFHDMVGTNLTNAANLFEFGTVAIRNDTNGRPFIITDTTSLIDTVANPDTYHLLGLVPGAVVVEENNDYTDNVSSLNGDENISRTFQAEWSYNVGIKGYAWDKTAGGASPTTAAVGTSANWDKYVSSDKDGPGVILKVDFAA